MKKLLALVLTVALLTTLSFACAEANDPFGIQIIAGPEEESEPVSMDDIKLGAELEFPGYAIILPKKYEWIDRIVAHTGNNLNSGEEAEYATLVLDITNMSQESKNYIDVITVKLVFDDDYEYGGWVLQYDLDESDYPLGQGDSLTIDPFYVGHYLLGCTLPNYIVNSTAPLRMEINIDGNELTYNIRK